MLSDFPVMTLLPATDISRARTFYANKLNLAGLMFLLLGMILHLRPVKLPCYISTNANLAQKPTTRWLPGM